MKIFHAVVAAYLLAAVGAAEADTDNTFRRRTKGEAGPSLKDRTEAKDDAVFEDDAAFWHRFLPKEVKSLPPTAQPTRPPTMGPTTPPTSPPTSPPSNLQCQVEATIDCTTVDGVPCEDITFPEGQCSTGEPLDTITFSFQVCDCDASQNEQDGIATCEDCGPFPDTPVVVMCLAGSGAVMTVSPMMVDPGDLFTVTNPAGGNLPEILNCSMSTGNGEKIQRDIINVSGDVTLQLKDKFGAFTVESCDTLSCIETIRYDYDITNVGTDSMNITLVEVTNNGNTTSFLDQVPINPLAPGQTTTVVEFQDIDICIEQNFLITIDVEADPPDGAPCFANDTYSFGTNSPPTSSPSASPSANPSNLACSVDTSIDCTTVDGVPCEDIMFPEGQCSTGEPLDTITFSFQVCDCDASQNEQEGIATCEDCGPFPDTPVVVMCQDGDGAVMTVAPMMVDPGDLFTVTNPAGGNLPEILNCSMSTGNGEKIQRDIINVSGDVTLQLKDKFGAFTVESCDTLSCIEEVCYDYDITNVGTDFMNITIVEVTNNGNTTSFLDQVPINPLAPGQTTTVKETQNIDICIEQTFLITIEVEADPPDGASCFANDTYTFETNPKCIVDSDLTCEVGPGPDGAPYSGPYAGECEDLEGEQLLQCRCENCVDQVIFTYTAAVCDAGNIGQNGLISCEDGFGGPSGSARVIVSDSDNQLFDNTVGIGDEIIVEDLGNCIGPILRVQVFQPMTQVLLQEIFIDATCTPINDITLLDPFGAVDFVGYTCLGEDEEPHNCFVDVTYELCVSNVGGVDFNITQLDFTFQEMTQDLLSDIPEDDLIVLPGNSYKQYETKTVERCANTMYCAEMEASGSSEDTGAICEDKEELKFDVTTSSPFPTSSPSNVPSASPSAAPSPQPSPEPSPFPSPEPSPNPSPEPSPFPSPVPSPAPSASPSAEPTAAPSPVPNTSMPPSAMPTTPCMLDFNSTCQPPPELNSPDGTCEGIPPQVQQCEGRPVRMVMLYNGGDCSQAFNIQGDLYECFDVGAGVPTEDGVMSYIKVVSLKDENVIYHEDWVAVGTNYDLTLPEGEDRVEANMNITIYSENITLPEFQLQNLRYHSSCSQNLFLKDRFGASQLVEWENEDQGVITCFATAFFTFDLTIPIDIVGDEITLTSAISITNFGVFNLTDEVAGMTLAPGATLSLTFNVSFDLTERRRYTGLTTITGITDEDVTCRGIDFFSFLAGNELPDTFPSLAPTAAPTITAGPTPNPLETPCDLGAEIFCSSSEGDCSDLGPPAASVCVGDNPDQLKFIFNAMPCSASNTTGRNFKCETLDEGVNGNALAFITFTDDDDVVLYEGLLNIGQMFTVTMTPNLPDRINVLVSAANPTTGIPTVALQEIEFRGTCQEGRDDLSLLTQYGTLQLVSFSSPVQGTNSAVEDIKLTYRVRNDGKLTAIAQTLDKTSTLQGDGNLISPPGVQLARGLSQSFVDTTRLNLYAAAGSTFEQTLTTSGVGMMSQEACADATSSGFSIGT